MGIWTHWQLFGGARGHFDQFCADNNYILLQHQAHPGNGMGFFMEENMAATRLIPLHINKGKTAAASIKDRIDYAEDPNKTENGNLVVSYECDPRLAWQEFMLDRGRYLAAHGSERESDVIGYQIRQAFKPGMAETDDIQEGTLSPRDSPHGSG